VKDIPSDYYVRLAESEASHWWQEGMRSISRSLLEPVLEGRTGLALLDAGCGAGGFLAWARGLGAFDRLAGVDLSPDAIELARRIVPEAELRIGALPDHPFAGERFDVAVLNDVLQHLHERIVQPSLVELHRALAPSGHLLVRTNAGRRERRERRDWRLYDAATLKHALEQAGFRVTRLTPVNLAGALWAALRGRGPQAPTSTTCGIPEPKRENPLGLRLLHLEARYLRSPGRSLPYGHTQFAVAKAEGTR
jgi:SAM-dependent methyltransferase